MLLLSSPLVEGGVKNEDATREKERKSLYFTSSSL